MEETRSGLKTCSSLPLGRTRWLYTRDAQVCLSCFQTYSSSPALHCVHCGCALSILANLSSPKCLNFWFSLKASHRWCGEVIFSHLERRVTHTYIDTHTYFSWWANHSIIYIISQRTFIYLLQFIPNLSISVWHQAGELLFTLWIYFCSQIDQAENCSKFASSWDSQNCCKDIFWAVNLNVCPVTCPAFAPVVSLVEMELELHGRSFRERRGEFILACSRSSWIHDCAKWSNALALVGGYSWVFSVSFILC